jgi:hypothetical protein
MSFPASRARIGRAVSVVVCAFALSAMSAGIALAQTAGKQKSFGKAPAKGLVMTRSELRACMAQQERLRTGREEATRMKAQLEQERQDLARSATELKEQFVWLDRYDKEQVDRYNQQAADRDKAVASLQTRMGDFNTQAQAVNADGEAFARSCENRRFDEDDEIAIKAGK